MGLKDIKYSQDCWVFYGSCDWSIDSAYDFIESAGRIFEMFGTKATHYGFSETPYDTIKGAHIGSARNVIKKTDSYNNSQCLPSAKIFAEHVAAFCYDTGTISFFTSNDINPL